MLLLALTWCWTAKADQLNEGFENSDFPPSDWTSIHVSGANSWARYTSSKHSGSASAYAHWASAGHENYLITPKLEPSNGESLSFFVSAQSYSGTTLKIEVSVKDPIATDFATELATYTTGSSGTIGTTSTSTFVEKTIDLSGYVGQQIYIAFHVIDNNGGDVIIDDVTGVSLYVPSCVKPASLGVSNIDAHSAILTWGATSGVYNVEYKEDSQSEWTSAGVNLSVETVTLSGLKASTTYEARVQSVCTGETSDWKTISFTTPCEAYAIPYTYDFEDAAPFACWTPIAGAAIDNTSSNVHSGSKYLKFSGTTNNMIAFPAIDADLTNLRLEFWTRPESNTNSSCGKFAVGYMTDLTDASSFVALANYNYNDWSSATYVKKIVDYNADGVPTDAYIAMRQYDNSTSWYWFVDDITVKEIPSCLEPAGLAVSSDADAIGPNSIKLQFTAGESNESAWKLQYKKSADSEWTTITDAITENPYELPGLLASTQYDIRIAAWCDPSNPDGISGYTEPIQVATACEVVNLSLSNYFMNFDDYSGISDYTPASRVLPICWSFINECAYSSYKFYPTISSYYSTSYGHSGSNYLRFYSYYSSYTDYDPQPQYAILPQMSDLAGKQITLWARGYNAASSFKIGWMSDPTDVSTFNLIDEQTFTSSNYSTYQELTYEIPATISGNYIAIMIDAASSSRTYNGVYIDDIVVEPVPSCKKPSALMLEAPSSRTAHTATLKWTNGEEGQDAWQIAYSTTADFNPADVTPVDVTTNPATIEGLAQSTTYYAYVRANCGNGDYSAWSTTKATFTTLAGNVTPSGLAVEASTITSSQATASWNAVAGNTLHESYDIYWAESTVTAVPDEPAAPNFISGITATSQDIIGLTPETTYKVWVRDNCGTDGLSAWSSAVSFTTLASCAVPFNVAASEIKAHDAKISWDGNSDSYNVEYRTAAYMSGIEEGFESGNLPSGWTNEGAAAWSVGTGDYSASTGAHSGSYNAKITHGTTGNETYLITPVIDLSGASDSRISLWYINRSWSSDTDGFGIYYRVNGGAWTEIFSTSTGHSVWTQYDEAIPDGAKVANCQFGFKFTDAYGYGAAIDDIQIGSVIAAGDWQRVNGTELNKQITGLVPETKYDVQVLGVCGATTTEPSEIVSFTTLPSCLPVSDFAVSNVNATSADLSWTNGATSQDAWQICLNGDETTLIDVTDNPFTLTGLADGANYSVKIRANCGGGDYSEWSGTIDFSTPQMAVALPFNEDFESGSKWLLVNGDLENAWVIGNATNNGGTKALYISNDDGVSNEYTVNSSAMVYATKLFNFEAGKYAFSYDWKAKGEAGYSIYDYLRVALVPSTVELSAATSTPSGFSPTGLPSGWIALDGGEALVDEDSWQKKEVVIDVPAAGAYKMVLAWRDDTSGGDNPPAAIDNVHIVKVDSIHVNASRYATFYTENYAYIMPDGLTGYAFTVESHMSDAIYEADDIVPANAALVLESAKGDTTYWPVPTFVDVPNMSVTNDLHGVNEATIIGSATDSKAYYVLSLNGASEPESVGFYYMLDEGKGGFELPAHKAYLVVDNPSSAPAAFYLFNGENGATWLNSLEGVEGTVKFLHEGNIYILRDSIIYDATGRKVRELK